MMGRYLNSNPKRSFLLLNCFMLGVGNVGGPLVMRLYFNKGGKSVWLSSWLETGGWPFMLLPLIISYFNRNANKDTPEAKYIFIKPSLFGASAFLGVLTGLDNFIYANGVSRLPASTSVLIISTQLAFTAGFAFLLVKQRFTSYSINAIFMLTMGAVILGLHTSGDVPAGESTTEYYLGFFMTLGASALYGLVLPLVELTYQKAKQTITYPLVLQIQLVISLFATAFCTVGMIVNNDFQAISREGKEYELGQVKYYVVLVFVAILWQFFFLGAIGVIFYASSLLSGIVIAVLLPLTETLAVLFYHERFQVEKGIALTLSLWGFVNYFYGELKKTGELSQTPESEPLLPVQASD